MPSDDHEPTSASGVEADLGDAADYLCDECSKGFDSLEEQQLHLEEVHGREDYEHSLSPQNTNLIIGRGSIKAKERICFKCGEIFRTHIDIYRHMTSHLVTSNFSQPFKSARQVVCTLCNEELSETFLYSHLVQSHSNFNPMKVALFCPICSYHCSDASNFYQHLRLRHAKRILECKPCQMAFKSFEFLNKHVLEQHNIDLNKYSAVPCRLTIPKKKVVAEKISPPMRKSKLKYLQLKLTPAITSNSLFICSACNEFYSDKVQLQNHVGKSCKGRPKRGRPPKPFHCAFCKETYGNVNVYASHLILQHSHLNTLKGTSKIKCSRCSALFTNSLDLFNHTKFKHNEPCVGCLVCNAMFHKFERLQEHLIHNHKMDFSKKLWSREPKAHQATAKQTDSGEKKKKTAKKWKITSISKKVKSSSPNQLLPNVTELTTKTRGSAQKLSTNTENSCEKSSTESSNSALKTSSEATISLNKSSTDSAICTEDSSAMSENPPKESTEAIKSPTMALLSLKELSTKAVNALMGAPITPLDDTNSFVDVENSPPESPAPASPIPSPDMSVESPVEIEDTSKEEDDLAPLQDTDVKLSAPVLVKILRIPSLDANVMTSVQLPKGTKELNLQNVLSNMASLKGEMVPKISTLKGATAGNKKMTSVLCEKWVTMRTKLSKNFYKDFCGRWQCRICKFQTVSLSIIRFHTSKNHTVEALKSQQPLANRFMASPENNIKIKKSIIKKMNPLKFKCSDCSMSFMSHRGMLIHKSYKHNPKLHSRVKTEPTTAPTAVANAFCEYCKKGFKTLFALKCHRGKTQCGSTWMIPKQEHEEKDEDQPLLAQSTLVKVEPDVMMELDPLRIKDEVSNIIFVFKYIRH